MERLTKRVNGYAHGAEGRTTDTLTGKWCRGTFESTAIVDRLAEYEDLEESGRLHIFPCAVGDTVYWLNNWYRTYGDYKVDSEIVRGFIFDGGEIIVDLGVGKRGTFNTVFLTREAAEAKLKEMKEE